MNTPEEILELARTRYKESKVLFESELYDGAFYLLGYSIELILKHKICLLLELPDLFSIETDHSDKPNSSGFRKVLRTHNLTLLLLMSGLWEKFKIAKGDNRELMNQSSLLIEKWNESCRYHTKGYCNPLDLQHLFNLMNSENSLYQWILRN